jgi:hypothetical protein
MVRARGKRWPYGAMGAGAQAAVRAAALALLAGLCGCATQQTHGSVTIGTHLSAALQPGQLQAGGVAFITPATVTGQEEDRPLLSLVFTEALAELRPGVHVVPLDETLSAVSRAGADEAYRRMMNDARESGLLDLAALAQVSRATGARYIAQLKMAEFHQESQDRFSALGLRMVQTKKADIRLFLRIWDGSDGAVAWEGAQELQVARETVTEKAISFHDVVDESARQLIARLP